jgi:hypothetical protein
MGGASRPVPASPSKQSRTAVTGGWISVARTQGAQQAPPKGAGTAVSDLQLTEDRDVRQEPGPDGPGTPLLRRGPVPGRGGRAVLAAVSPAALWRRHKLFTFLVICSLLVRVLATRAFRPALLTADSFLYMRDAVARTLGVIRPSGYSFFLHALLPLHSLLAVTALQHLMGVAIAAIVYGLLRYHGLPFWGATLAAMPTLFDTRQIALESFILPDTLYCFVIVVAVALLLTKQAPRLWQCGLAGLLLAYAAVLRGNGLPVVIIAVVFMIIRRVGWRALAAGVLAAVIPFGGYVAAYHASHGQYNITSSDGIFLWSRTTSFANCAIIKPPADLKPLCPNLEKSVQQPPTPAWSVQALLSEATAADYLWASDVWWRTDSDPGINAHNDKLGQRFAIAAIKAQPLDYLRTVGRDVALVFTTTDRPQEQSTMTFTVQPHILKLPPYYVKDLKAYADTTQNTHSVQPYAYFLFLYQQPVVFGGLLFLFAVFAGLAGVLRSWRRWGGLQALPWVIAAVSIVLPAMLTQSLYRYTIVAIPLACLAAGMAFIRPDRRAALAAAGPGAVAWTAPGPGTAGAGAAGTGTAGTGTAVGAGAVGAAGFGAPAAGAASGSAAPGVETAAWAVPAGETSAWAVPAGETAAWAVPAGETAELGHLAPDRETPDPASADPADADVWPGHTPVPDVWASRRPVPDESAWPMPAAAEPDASTWATPPSGTPVPDTSAWAEPEAAGPAVPAHELAAHDVAAHELAAHEATAPSLAAHEIPVPGLAVPEPAIPEPAMPEPAIPEPGTPEPGTFEPVASEPEASESAGSEFSGSGSAAPGAAGLETPHEAAPHPDTSAWATPPAAPRPAAPRPATPPASLGVAVPEPEQAVSPAEPPATPASVAPGAGLAPQVPPPAEAAPDESDWEDSLWETPSPRTSAPLQVPPGPPAWHTPTASTPAWQAPSAGGPHWQAAGPVASAGDRTPQSPAPAGPAGETAHPAGAGEPADGPSRATPPAPSPESADPSGPPSAEASPPAPADES